MIYTIFEYQDNEEHKIIKKNARANSVNCINFLLCFYYVKNTQLVMLLYKLLNAILFVTTVNNLWRDCVMF